MRPPHPALCSRRRTSSLTTTVPWSPHNKYSPLSSCLNSRWSLCRCEGLKPVCAGHCSLSSYSLVAMFISEKQTLLQTLKRLVLMAVFSCENDGQMLRHRIHSVIMVKKKKKNLELLQKRPQTGSRPRGRPSENASEAC